MKSIILSILVLIFFSCKKEKVEINQPNSITHVSLVVDSIYIRDNRVSYFPIGNTNLEIKHESYTDWNLGATYTDWILNLNGNIHSNTTCLKSLAQNVRIDSSLTFVNNVKLDNYHGGASISDCGAEEGEYYIGFRIKQNSKFIYGWMKIEYTYDSLLIKEYAYNSTIGKSIMTGEISN